MGAAAAGPVLQGRPATASGLRARRLGRVDGLHAHVRRRDAGPDPGCLGRTRRRGRRVWDDAGDAGLLPRGLPVGHGLRGQRLGALVHVHEVVRRRDADEGEDRHCPGGPRRGGVPGDA